MDNLYKEGQSLERSHILADELEENARNIRENLSNQNAQLQVRITQNNNNSFLSILEFNSFSFI